jgi:hypothetical protein
MDDTSIRFRIAIRIHAALLREIGEGIDLSLMIGSEPYACEVLYVCESLGLKETRRLARLFRLATEQERVVEREEAALYARLGHPARSAQSQRPSLLRAASERGGAVMHAGVPRMLSGSTEP